MAPRTDPPVNLSGAIPLYLFFFFFSHNMLPSLPCTQLRNHRLDYATYQGAALNIGIPQYLETRWAAPLAGNL